MKFPSRTAGLRQVHRWDATSDVASLPLKTNLLREIPAEGVGLRISIRSTLVLLAFALVLPAFADESAKSLYRKGQQAEARQNFLEAYEAYKAAYEKKPTDLRYRSSFERLRFQAGMAHVKQGQRLRDGGDLEKALQEFQTAAQVDPSSFIAQQEITRTKDLIAKAAATNGNGGSTQQQPKREDILRQRIEQAQGPVILAPINDQAITLRISGDSKTIYQTIGKLAGINVLFDPDYVSRQLPVLELNGVTLQEALGLVSIQSNTFWRPVTPNTIFVAPNTQTKRKDLDQSVVKTFYLTNAATQTEFQDIANTLRTIVDITRVQPIAAENALVVRGSPDKVALAEKIVSDLDKSRAEVVVDVAILQVSRQKTRDLGLTPPLANGAIGVQLTTPGSTTSSSGSSSSSSSSSNNSSNGLTLNTFKNLNATNFSVTVPQAQLNALLSDSSTKLLQNPQIRASDGQKADLKIGSKIPVATGSFQPGIGGVGINPLVNTQFQYLDVGVNITITPTVHLNGDVTLKVLMDISSQTGTTDIGGISQPIISQRKVEHQIRLREGEANMLGGILEDQDNRSFGGVPGLGQIPLLKYIFGHENIDRRQNEVVFVLIPHLVRYQDVTDLNLRAIDVGTENYVDLRVAPSRPARGGQGESPQSQFTNPQQPQVQPAAAQAVATPAANVGGVQNPPSSGTTPVTTPSSVAPQEATPNPNTPPAQGQAQLRFDPPSITTSNGGTFSVNVTMSGASDVASVPLQISYDPKHLSVVKIDNGDFLTRDAQPVALVHRDDTNTGTLVASAARPPGAAGITGQGTVFTVTFVAKDKGDTVLSITRPGARNSQQQPIQVLGSQMTVRVQ